MSTLFQVIILVLGVIVMIVLFLQNQYFKERLVECEKASHKLENRVRELDQERALYSLEVEVLNEDYTEADRDRRNAWFMLEHLLENEITPMPSLRGFSATVDSHGVFYMLTSEADAVVNSVLVTGPGAAITESESNV